MIAITNTTLPVYNISNWGRCGWNFISAIAFVYPDEPSADEISHMKSFLSSTARVLPCHVCRDHFAVSVDNMRADDLRSKQQLLFWVHRVQNEIRRRLGRQQIPYDVMHRVWTKGYDGVIAVTWKQLTIVLLVALVLAVIHIYKRKV